MKNKPIKIIQGFNRKPDIIQRDYENHLGNKYDRAIFLESNRITVEPADTNEVIIGINGNEVRCMGYR